jgi:hypothetical protein
MSMQAKQAKRKNKKKKATEPRHITQYRFPLSCDMGCP